ncbi:MAG: serine/threonine-protein kinase [Planctomycetota bacterium]|nr:serine/threonine-protein kinase [Planctomycetota bacterium]
MSDTSPKPSQPVSADRQPEIHEVCHRFEQAWQAGESPQIEDFLSNDSPSDELLAKLIELDLQHRLANDSEASIKRYFDRFPGLVANPAMAVNLIRVEFEIRHRQNPEISADDYLEDFPSLRLQLTEEFNRHRKSSKRRFPIRLNCPHCNDPIAVGEGESSEEEVVCPSCGSSFHLEPDRTTSWSTEKLPELGKFKLLAAIGKGAFGTVYKAEDTELHRIVAVKVPRSGSFHTPEDEDRFMREARNAAQLSHPGIVPVFDVGRSNACPYIVTEFVEGVTLADALTARRFGAREATRLVMQLAQALEHAHRQGVVHRDLKPSNIILEMVGPQDSKSKVTDSDATLRDGSTVSSDPSSKGTRRESGPEYFPRLMDFGLARRDTGEVTVTQEGQILGTPAYMSPEQAKGEGHQADNRADIYSLGVILFELLTGERPFRGSQRMLLHQVIHDDAPSPRKLNNALPRDLETICLRCLEKDLDKRFQSAAELAAELNRCLKGEPIHSRPIGRVERAARWCRRNPVTAGLLTTIAGLLLVLGIAGPIIAFRQATLRKGAERARNDLNDALAKVQKSEQEARSATATAEQATTDAENSQVETQLEAERSTIFADDATSARDELRRSLYFAHMNQVQHAVELADTNRADQLLNLYVPQSGEEDLRGWEWYYWWRQSRNFTKSLGFSSQYSIAYSPDGKYLAGSDRDHNVVLFDLASGLVTASLKGHSSAVGSLVFSRDGKWLASSSEWDRKVFIWDIAKKQALSSFMAHGGSGGSIHFLPGGKTLATAGCDEGAVNSTIKVWEFETGRELSSRPLGDNFRQVDSLAVSPNGRIFAVVHHGGPVRFLDADSDKELARIENAWGCASLFKRPQDCCPALSRWVYQSLQRR